MLAVALALPASPPAHAEPPATATEAPATIWLVGPLRPLKTPGAAARVAKDGDTVEIDAGIYTDDYAEWRQRNLTIRGIGGMAHLRSTQLIPNGKAIWIMNADNALVENVEFSGARVMDGNGAGIRHESGSLTLRNTFFHRNEFSVLTGNNPHASLEIESSRFWFQRREHTFSHGIYVGALKRFSITGSHIKGTDRGHQIKSRARENYILYNRIEDIPEGNASRLMDLSNCGLSVVIGNDLQQSTGAGNLAIVGYGAEGCEGRAARERQLFVVHNTLVNEARGGALVWNHANARVLVANNLVFGRGPILQGEGEQHDNVRLDLSLRVPGSWEPPPGSAAIDAARALPDAEGMSLHPVRVFEPPQGTAVRFNRGVPDIGSRELAPDDPPGSLAP